MRKASPISGFGEGFTYIRMFVADGQTDIHD